MSNLPATCSVGSRHSVIAALFASSPNLVIGGAIYHLSSVTAEAQHGGHYGGYIHPTTDIRTAHALPNIYGAVFSNDGATYSGNSHSSRYTPSGFRLEAKCSKHDDSL